MRLYKMRLVITVIKQTGKSINLSKYTSLKQNKNSYIQIFRVLNV